MKTEKMYNQSLKKISEIQIMNDVVAEIKVITQSLVTKRIAQWTGDEISRALSDLAVLRVNLGQVMADAVAKYDFSYLHRKVRYASEWNPTKQHLQALGGKATVSDIESELQKSLIEEFQLEIENKHFGETLRILYDSTGTLISALQSRLNMLKQERRETRHYNN